jgi:hypothetical protein
MCRIVLVMHSVSVIAEACICGAVIHFTTLQPQRDSDQIAFVVISFVMTLGACALNIARVRTALLRLSHDFVDFARRVSERSAKAANSDTDALTQNEGGAVIPEKAVQAAKFYSSSIVMPVPESA